MRKPSREKASFLKIFTRILLGILSLIIITLLTVVVFFRLADRTNGRMISSGEVRRYLLYVPDSLDPTTPAPLVISIHGYLEWPAHQRDISGWNNLADEFGFIVVYPGGTGFPKHWRTFDPSNTEDELMKDVNFISTLIDKLESDYNIDPARIYANGLSNGGGMSYLLGCRLTDRFAAIGGVSGAYLLPLEDCRPSRPLPMIAFHGTADQIVPYAGGPSHSFDIPFPNIPQWMANRAAMNGCSPNPSDIPPVGEVSGIRYSGCEADADIVFYTIAGGGHAWPGGEPLPEWIAGYTTQDVSATRIMWEFFLNHTQGD